MLNYIAAIATAVTLSISPMLSHANVTPIATKKVAVATHTDISVNNQVIIVNTAAVLSSVKIIRPKQITA
jgi:hypothetical protein